MKATDTSSNDSTSNSNSKENNEADTEESDEIPNPIGVAVGPTTRRAWSDWCSSRGKSSKENSDDDTAVIPTPSQRTQRSNSQGQRGRRGKKKVLRKKMARKKVLVQIIMLLCTYERENKFFNETMFFYVLHKINLANGACKGKRERKGEGKRETGKRIDGEREVERERKGETRKGYKAAKGDKG